MIAVYNAVDDNNKIGLRVYSWIKQRQVQSMLLAQSYSKIYCVCVKPYSKSINQSLLLFQEQAHNTEIDREREEPEESAKM